MQDVQSTIVDEISQQNLNLFRDADGLLRHSGRLEHADARDNVKYPYLLLQEHRFPELVVICSYESLSHNG